MPIRMSSRAEGAFQILLDRQSALDIGAFVVDGVDMAPGIAVPSDGDPRIDHALQGFLFTCGPDHIRHPEPVENSTSGKMFPLHGSLCGNRVNRTEMNAEGEAPGCLAETVVSLADGGQATVSRRWSIDDDASEVSLLDRVTNTGDSAFAPMLMYHMNLGGWLLGDDTVIASQALDGGQRPWRFGDGESAHVCLPAVADADAQGWAHVRLGPFAALAGRSLHVRFRTDTLPFLQMWRCQRGEADVIAIEPVSHRIAKRTELAASGEMPLLHPGETIAYALCFHVG